MLYENQCLSLTRPWKYQRVLTGSLARLYTHMYRHWQTHRHGHIRQACLHHIYNKYRLRIMAKRGIPILETERTASKRLGVSIEAKTERQKLLSKHLSLSKMDRPNLEARSTLIIMPMTCLTRPCSRERFPRFSVTSYTRSCVIPRTQRDWAFRVKATFTRRAASRVSRAAPKQVILHLYLLWCLWLAYLTWPCFRQRLPRFSVTNCARACVRDSSDTAR